MERFDLLVLGAGAAGFAAARTAGGQGATVALVDKGPLGGLCILWGCMPSKALLRTSEVIELIRHAGELGLDVAEPSINWGRIMARRERLVREFADYRIEQIDDCPNTTLVMGEAHFLDARTVQVGERTLYGEHIIIATGSHTFIPPISGLADAGYITSDEALELPERPASMIVLGAGAVGLELGQFYQRMGCQVTIIQRSAHILSTEDADVAEALTKSLLGDGMTILCRAKSQSARRIDNQIELQVDAGGELKTLRADQLLVATGRVGNLGFLDLAKAGLVAEKGFLPVDEQLRTTVPHIFAAGDVTGKRLLVHLGIQQAEWAAHNALHPDRPHRADYRLIPQATFTDPGVADVGLKEREAKAQGLDVLIGKYEFAEHGKAMCMGTPAMKGFVKLIGDAKTGEILGASIVGPEAADLLHELIVAMHYRAKAGELALIPHVHPTLAEIVTYPAEEIEDQRRARGLI
ncbi:MAG: dihydrolipoyl dehydrogenase [Candidatus Sericytochromatia bacterium]|nr:dihydrolipoyl dehydrogenase [Candidatus Sericytochromatia bacterium]